MSHIEKRANLWYATLTVPPDVRTTLGKNKFLQTTQTSNKTEARHRAAVLVSGWKSEIAKARGTAPSPQDTFWESLKRQHAATDDEGTQLAIEELAEQMALKSSNPELSSELYKLATNQQGTLLAPLVEDWKKAQRGGQKTIDQKHRDLVRMSDYFISLEALQPQKIKTWTDKLLADEYTYSSFLRIGGACRSLWRYLKQSGAVTMVAPDPFVGPFELALTVAPRTVTGRAGSAYSPEEMTSMYVAAITKGDQPLADLIALGAYTGARIEELGRLTKETCQGGVFTIKKSKTSAGLRQCPIHPAVAPLVARMLEASKDGFLVPSSAANQYGNRTAPAGQRYGHLKTAQGFGDNLVFHSTRNTLITLMEQAGVPEGIACDTVGHGKKTMTYGLYSAGSSMTQKFEAISKANYPGALGAP